MEQAAFFVGFGLEERGPSSPAPEKSLRMLTSGMRLPPSLKMKHPSGGFENFVRAQEVHLGPEGPLLDEEKGTPK